MSCQVIFEIVSKIKAARIRIRLPFHGGFNILPPFYLEKLQRCCLQTYSEPGESRRLVTNELT